MDGEGLGGPREPEAEDGDRMSAYAHPPNRAGKRAAEEYLALSEDRRKDAWTQLRSATGGDGKRMAERILRERVHPDKIGWDDFIGLYHLQSNSLVDDRPDVDGEQTMVLSVKGHIWLQRMQGLRDAWDHPAGSMTRDGKRDWAKVEADPWFASRDRFRITYAKPRDVLIAEDVVLGLRRKDGAWKGEGADPLPEPAEAAHAAPVAAPAPQLAAAGGYAV